MKKPTRNDLILLGIIVIAVLAAGIGLGRCSKKTVIIKDTVDVSGYNRIIDSVEFARKKDSVVISYMNFIVDSLNRQLKDKNQHDNETKQIKRFTSVSRLRWADSVFRSEGLR